MMFINNIVAAAILAASAVTARNITLCEDPDFKTCHYPDAPVNYCIYTPLISDTTSSLDTGGATCEFFVDFGCFPKSESFNYTGQIKEFGLQPGLEHFDNTISSFKCR
ncbi:uncharacterized protein L3040_000181 [Drepanopeziza brunnea f. sp. 'multigermtubi']|uniref:uncharacterized protein n=1 Tax=Drepanopeziza brunnea f. sp. 'multigermtubi' TaxID=698441 RepID=UPI0023916A85|nr:hypothetical protein L3040_000181 [Drepanopeziza brunnea f. sp. 'multigermtubi']